MKKKLLLLGALLLMASINVSAEKVRQVPTSAPRFASMGQSDMFDYTYNIYETNLTKYTLKKVSNNHYDITIKSSDNVGDKGGIIFHVLNVDFGSNTNIEGEHTIVQETSIADKINNKSYLVDTDPSMNYIPYGTITFTKISNNNYTIAIAVKAYNYWNGDYTGYCFVFDNNPTLPVYAFDTDGITPITLDGSEGGQQGEGDDHDLPDPSKMNYSDDDQEIDYTIDLEGKQNVSFAVPATSPSYFVVTKRASDIYRISAYKYGGSGQNDYSYRTQIDLIVDSESDCEGIPSGTYVLRNSTDAGTAILPTYTGHAAIDDGITNISGSFADIDYINWGNQIFWAWMMTSGTVEVTHIDEDYYINVLSKNSFNKNVNYTIGAAPKTITLTAGNNGSAKIVYKSSSCWNNKEYAAGTNKFFVGQTISLEAKSDEGYEFEKWNDGNTDNPREITVSDDASYIASFVASSSVLVLNDNENNASVLSTNLDKEQDIQLMRTFQAGMWNTVCLPFALDADQIAAAFGEGTQVGSMTRGEMVNEELILGFNTNVTTMNAGYPYIILLGNDENVVNPTFEGVTITTTEAGVNTSDDFVYKFVGTFSPVTNYTPNVDLYLGTGNTVHPISGGTLNGFRAYFANNIGDGGEGDDPAPEAPKRVRMVINGAEETTAMDEMEVLNPAEKMIENGQVVIIKNGVKYNVFGQQL